MWFLHVFAMTMNKLNKSNAPAFLVVVVATMHMDSSRSLREVCQRTKCKIPKIIGCNMAKPPEKNDEQNFALGYFGSDHDGGHPPLTTKSLIATE